jgi:hypothetical protein
VVTRVVHSVPEIMTGQQGRKTQLLEFVEGVVARDLLPVLGGSRRWSSDVAECQLRILFQSHLCRSTALAGEGATASKPFLQPATWSGGLQPTEETVYDLFIKELTPVSQSLKTDLQIASDNYRWKVRGSWCYPAFPENTRPLAVRGPFCFRVPKTLPRIALSADNDVRNRRWGFWR